jgi:hypothetical protein
MSNNSFYIQAYYNGGLTGFEVIPNDGAFNIARNGEIIATLQRNPTWQQTAGEPLPDDVLQSIYQQIEKPEA